MSAVVFTFDPVTSPHPWRRLRDAAHVTLEWHDGGVMGLTRFADSVISLRRGMTWEQRRCTVQHELVHMERGPVPHTLAGREEQRVRRETARIMLPDVHRLGEALAWALNEDEAAHELDVDPAVLLCRLENLHPAELHYLRRRLDGDGI